MLVKARIQKWGNGLGLRISGVMRELPQFKEGVALDVTVTEQGLSIVKSKKQSKLVLPHSEAMLLKGLNSDSVHSDDLFSLLDGEGIDDD
jgi:antitoxin MazE